ncbi:zinc finger matrin-type protein 5-like isoform X2 [Daphnia pulicaria]|uniref:zinc finger matrin-type protein 5-like isoform X2 n=1 Tax=Daphnia pulicaria TaxID=35523 RepID=UPI001EEAEBE1|nr:zinc finger matrin-type protein 5-like isoform X2 [Daphnia pulicaria]
MGKKYYCDYCDASFPDSKEGRKKHNLGLVHQRMKEAHFKQFTDSRTKLAQELQKTPCRRYLQGFPCKFGDDCRFSHLLPHEIDHLRYAAEMEETACIKFPSQLLKKDQPPIEDFVKKVEQLVREKEMASDKSSLWSPFENGISFFHFGRMWGTRA